MSRKDIAVYDSIADLNENQWNNLVSQSSTGSVFQRTEWLRAVEEGLRSTPKHVVVRQDANIIGVFPNFEEPIHLPDNLSEFSQFAPTKIVSLRPGFGGPVTTSTDESIFDRLFDGVEAAADGATAYHQLNFLDRNYHGYATYLERRGYVPSVKSCRFVVDLCRDHEEIREEMSSGRRRNLRNAEEQEYRVVDEDVDRNTIDEFYPKYVRVMERVGGEPLSRRFFDQLAGRLGERIKIFRLEVDGTPAGRHLCLLDEEQGTVHYYFSAVEEADFEYYPSELLHAHAIQWGSNRGYERYDFGETPTDFSDGLFNFKKQFGGELVPTLTWEAGVSTGKWYLFRLARWFVRRRFSVLRDVGVSLPSW